MKATGIVRRIDDLGRVVIPKEIRRTMRIREGDPLEIYTENTGEVILKKYSIIGSGSVVLPNVTIGKGSAIGAMSLVKTSIPKWTICAGVPCKKVKKRSKDLKSLENKMIADQKWG